MKKIHIILLSAAMLLSLGASAQSFRSGYFLDNYVYGYRINPAQVNDRAFLGLAIGNIDLQHRSGLSVSQFLYPLNGNLVTGLNNAITPETFLSKFNKSGNPISLDESINLLALGIANGQTMHTIELNVRAMGAVSLPYDLFALLKSGKAGTYNLGGLYADVTALADLSYGFSTHINENFSVGGRLHLLAGLMGANLTGNNSSITLSDSKIAAVGDMDVNASGIVSFGTNSEGNVDLGNVQFKPWPIKNFGAALDLGVQYTSDFGLEAMLSVTDLGAISWENSIHAHADAKLDYSGGKIYLEDGQIATNFQEILDGFAESITAPYVGAGKRGFRMMPCNIAAGAKYHMPFWSGLSVGLLGTYHIAHSASWYDVRLGATVTPARILSASGNIGYGTFGPTWGAALNLHLGPVNLLAGVDSYLGPLGKVDMASLAGDIGKKLGSVPFPVNKFIENVHLGLSFTF